jgi:HEAT repeat protein
MKSKFLTLILVLFLCVPVALVTAILLRRTPTHHGKSADMWFSQMRGDTNSEALNALRKMGKPAVEMLRAELKHPGRYHHFRAAWTLWHIGPAAREAVPDSIQAVDDPDFSVRVFATLALTEIGTTSEELARKMMPRLTGPNLRMSSEVADLLDSIDKERRTQNLPPIVRDEYEYDMTFLQSPVPAVRLRGGRKLAKLPPGDERATAALKLLANDTNGWVRQETVALLARRSAAKTNGAN